MPKIDFEKDPEAWIDNKLNEVKKGLERERAAADGWRACLGCFPPDKILEFEQIIRDCLKDSWGPETTCVFMRSKRIIRVNHPERGKVEL